MSTWLKLLPIELAGINDDEIVEPPYGIETGDIVVGDMPAMSKQLYGLGMALERDASQFALDARYCAEPEKKEALGVKAGELMTKSKTLKDMMWISLKDEFGLWDKSIAVRKGFKVVITEDDDVPPIIRLFRGMGGQEL